MNTMNAHQTSGLQGPDHNVNEVPFQIGQPNQGNTCYINSTLNALFHSPGMIDAFGYTQTNPRLNGTILEKFAKLLKVSRNNMRSEILFSNKDLVKHIFKEMRRIDTNFQENRQEDLQEFLVRFIKWLKEPLEHTRIAPHHPTRNSDLTESQLNNVKLSVLQGLFSSIKQVVKCENGHTSTVTNAEDIIALNIDPNSAITSLNDLLENYFEDEQMPPCNCPRPCNAYLCRTCNRHVKAKKSYRISKLPDTLIIVLKIFQHTRRGNLVIVRTF